MSILQQIETIINDEIGNFINTIASKCLDKKELIDIWNKKDFSNILLNNSKAVSLVGSPNTIKTDSTLLKLSKSELVELCKSKGLKVSGSKPELVDRILNADENKNNEKITKQLIKTTPTKKVNSPSIKKLIDKNKIIDICIKRNKYDNYEHEETGFVFNNKTKKVFGRQLPDGSVVELRPEDIDICNKYKLSYYIPDNLDNKSNLKDFHLKELDDDVYEEELDEEEQDESEYEEYDEEFYEEE